MKKRIIIDKKVINEIVNEVISRVINEQTYGDFNFQTKDNLTIKFIERSDILGISDILWDMLVKSYENIGGIKTYRSKEDFLRKVKYAKVVYEGNDIVACAIYRNMENSYKMVAIGCNQDENGKNGLQLIIKDDIEKLDYHFWAEVSGAIEHYFKKYNGYPMPNSLASTILNIDEGSLRLSNSDMVHYQRQIANEWYEKMIFGAKSKEVFDAAISAVEDYSKFMNEVNKINEEKLSGCRYTLKQAIYIIENIYRAHEEDNFNELIPSWHRALMDSLMTLQSVEQDRTVIDYIDYCHYLLETMPLLELHVLEI